MRHAEPDNEVSPASLRALSAIIKIDFIVPVYATHAHKKSKTIDLQVNLMKNLETTKKKLIFVYGEDDPWTGVAIPDPTNPNVKKYIVPHGSHTDEFPKYARYPGGQEIVDKIMADVKAILFP